MSWTLSTGAEPMVPCWLDTQPARTLHLPPTR